MSAQEEMTAPFVMVPVAVVRDPALRPIAKAVLAALLSHTGKNKPTCFPSQGTIAKEIGVNRSSVNAAIATLIKYDAVRIIRRGRGYIYDLTPTVDLLKKPATTRMTAFTDCAQNATGDLMPSPTSMSQNRTDNVGQTATNYISESDTNNYTTSTAAENGLRTESNNERLSGGNLERALDDEEQGALRRQLGAAAQRVGLRPDYVPDCVESVKADAERAVRELGGEPFNRGALDALMNTHGVAACWVQALMLRNRVFSLQKPVEKITPFYMACVKNRSPQPPSLTREQQAERFAVLFLADKITENEFPSDLRDLIWEAYVRSEIPF